MAADLPAAMRALTTGVTRVRVIDGGVAEGKALGEDVLVDLSGAETAELLARLEVEQPPGQWHCMCLGDPAIELWAGNKLRAVVGVHHGVSVRVDGWWSDAPLKDGEGLLRALAERGVPGPLEGLLADREMRAEHERARAAWLAKAPEALRSRLAALEGEGRMLPRHLQASDADVGEAVDAVRAALGGGAAAALLAWFGGTGGPWSGYPSYEGVAEVLLQRVPFEELLAAGEGGDEEVLFGLARFVARHDAAPRERRALSEGLRERLVALVRYRGDPDMWGRLARALEVSAERANDGVRIADAEWATTFAGPVACGGQWATLDGDYVVRFQRGQRSGIVRAQIPMGDSAELGAADEELIVTIIKLGEVWRVPVVGGSIRVIARGQARPTSPVGFNGMAAWLEQVALSGHRTATRVRVEGEEPIAEHAGNAWDLLCCGGALWWARHGGSLWSTLFGKNIHRADLLRWGPERRKAKVVTVLEGGDDGTSVPRLFSDGVRIAWTSGRKIGVLDPRDDSRRWFEVNAEILSICPMGQDVLVALGREDVGELVRLRAGGGQEGLARWQRARWERERLAVCGEEVVWNAGEHLWSVTLAR